MYFILKLLELSQTEADLKIPEYKTFDITNTISSVIRFNEQLYKDKDFRWSILFEEGIKNTIVSDEEILKNILQNILDVILKSVEMGDILVSVSNPSEDVIIEKNLTTNDCMLISLSSSSMLLSENDLEQMFDPYKIIDTNNRKNLLRAIILASAKNLVQSINGTIWVESALLKHTSFNIIIPITKNNA